MSLTVQNPGSTNDFSAFTRSAAWKLTQKLPPGYFVIGDAAYPLAENLLTPYPGKRLDADRDVFNFYLSQLRMTVEQSFGILVQTWGILWKPLRVKFTGRADVVNAVFRLHNFLRDEGVQPITAEEAAWEQTGPPPLDRNECLPEYFVTDFSSAPKKSGEVSRREAIRKALADQGMVRPVHNISRNADLG